jgi:N-acylneuraminate cytidylyltransferase
MWRAEQGWLRPLLCVDGIVEPQSLPRQVLPETYWQNGYVDITRPRTVLAGRMAGEKVLPFVVNEPILEIDYPEDLVRVEHALKSLTEGNNSNEAQRPRRDPV